MIEIAGSNIYYIYILTSMYDDVLTFEVLHFMESSNLSFGVEILFLYIYIYIRCSWFAAATIICVGGLVLIAYHFGYCRNGETLGRRSFTTI